MQIYSLNCDLTVLLCYLMASKLLSGHLHAAGLHRI